LVQDALHACHVGACRITIRVLSILRSRRIACQGCGGFLFGAFVRADHFAPPFVPLGFAAADWASIHLRTSSQRHAVTRSDSLEGEMNLPLFTQRQRVAGDIGT